MRAEVLEKLCVQKADRSVDKPAIPSTQDKKDLDKFTKFFALKAAQIIVQSRLGEKVQTLCKPQTTGKDWFNLAVQDLPEVLAETKKVLCGDIGAPRLPICVEISLRTVEGDHMVLETWCLGVLPEQCDPSVRVTYTVYNRMGTLLKSLVSVTRVTPAYKLSRRQGPESYVICYRIYIGDPQVHCLGEGYKQTRVGQLCTPVGTLHLSVSYRTKMTISPTQTGRNNSIMLKSDHFHSDFSPRHMRYKQNEENNASLSDTMKIGAFASMNPKPVKAIPDIMPIAPFSRLLFERIPSPVPCTECQTSKSDVVNEQDKNGNSDSSSRNGDGEYSNPGITMVSTNDDFIMVDLKTPFAETNAKSELGKFYREWQSAPPLQTFAELPTLAEQVQDLDQQLETFESNIPAYDDVLQSLCQSPNNN
ncbi:Autophagy-related 13 [Carabus blaptoides fortunei]